MWRRCVNCINHIMCQLPDPEDCSMFIDKSTYSKMPPVKIGDLAWSIRNQRGVYRAQRGIISEMFFTKDMKLIIVVSHISRGEWGDKVFATQTEAEAKAEALNMKG